MSLRRKIKKILPDLFFSKFFLVFCAFFLLAILVGLAKGTIKNYKMNSEIQDLQGEINRLDKQNQEFGQLIEYLKSESFIEQEGKLKLGLKKPGEQLVIIPQDNAIFNPEQNKDKIERANPVKWWSYFFKIN
jgi:cell division protein FtsB